MLNKLPILISKSDHIFPGFAEEMNIGRPRSIKAINMAKEDFDNHVLLITWPDVDQILKKEKWEELMPKIGVVCKLESINQISEKNYRVKLLSTQRMKILKTKKQNDVLIGEYSVLKTQKLNKKEITFLQDKILEILEKFGQKVPDRVKLQFQSDENINNFFYTVLQNYSENTDNFKQKILEENDLVKRFVLINKYIKFETQIKNINFSKIVDQTINRRVNKRFSKQQREFLLREKLKAIREELGETDPKQKEIANYFERINKEPFPKHVKDKLYEEITRYQGLPSFSGEANMIKSYIDWVINLPWYQLTEDKTSLKNAKKILDSNHFGLKKAKERIIEHLATNFFIKKQTGQIICLVGPPGVGKTSLGLSIAQAMKRKYARIALGGVKDEAEIRGHRRTYIGAMPGKIIHALKQVKTSNPVILIDEIDKLSSDYRGDPASAMLEVLDPGQNQKFVDNYIEEHYDLSKVMFIATANYEQGIPRALYDRMEVVYLSSYTEIEKIKIAEKYLVIRILKNLSLSKNQIEFQSSALKEIIKFYTRESGVRELERLIMKICRKVIVKILNKKDYGIVLTNKNIEPFLGKRYFEYTEKNKKSDIGVITGLAYTAFGGDILPIETTMFQGKGKLILTGKLGDVMKESANIAYDYIKSNSQKFGIDFDNFKNNDVHIHVPEGAIPKDGPSAGITITTALISLLKKQKVSNNLAMTGEITLRGNVLPIGGLREKLISATRSSIKKVFIPKNNKKNLKDLPKEVLDSLEIILVDNYLDVYQNIFEKQKKK